MYFTKCLKKNQYQFFTNSLEKQKHKKNFLNILRGQYYPDSNTKQTSQENYTPIYIMNKDTKLNKILLTKSSNTFKRLYAMTKSDLSLEYKVSLTSEN